MIGRSNVGKSTLFNKMIGQRKSIEDEAPGITRDRVYGETELGSGRYLFVDTGGIFFDSDDMNVSVKRQVEVAIYESDLLLFIVDGKVGLNPFDMEIARLLQQRH